MDLLKVRVSDMSMIAFGLFVNEPDRFADKVVGEIEKVYSASADSYCYKVILPNGSLVGFFCVPKDKTSKKVSVFYIKKECRTNEYTDAFWQLISDTVYGGVYESISRFHTENFVSLLSRNITILERKLFYGYNYILNS